MPCKSLKNGMILQKLSLLILSYLMVSFLYKINFKY